jgi:hypothetical protein
LLAPLYEQHEVSQKRASMSTRKRALEFFSRGRPTLRLFASETNFFRNFPQRCAKREDDGRFLNFQVARSSWFGRLDFSGD